MWFTQDKDEAITTKHIELRGDALKQAVRDVLKLPPLDDKPPHYSIPRGAGARKYPTKAYCHYAVETEPRIEALLTRLSDDALISRIPKSDKPAVLYISHRSADAELRDDPLIQELIAAAPDAAFFACDVRGIGDSQPNTCGANTFLSPYGSHYFYAAHGLMLDRPLLGQRTFDVLRVIQLLVAAGHKEIHLAGKGWGTLPATFAALLSNHVRVVTLMNPLMSYTGLAAADECNWPYAVMLPDVLEHFDLGDCYSELQPRNLKLIEPWGPADGMQT